MRSPHLKAQLQNQEQGQSDNSKRICCRTRQLQKARKRIGEAKLNSIKFGIGCLHELPTCILLQHRVSETCGGPHIYLFSEPLCQFPETRVPENMHRKGICFTSSFYRTPGNAHGPVSIWSQSLLPSPCLLLSPLSPRLPSMKAGTSTQVHRSSL